MSLKIGYPTAKIAFKRWNSLKINKSSESIEDLLSALASYFLGENLAVEYREFIFRTFDRITRVVGYDTRLIDLGINHTGWRIELPDEKPPKVIQPSFQFNGITYNSQETFDLARYIMTNVNIDFTDDPRLDFLAKLNPNFGFSVEKAPDHKLLLDKHNESKAFDETMKFRFSTPLHSKILFSGVLVAMLGSGQLIHYLDLKESFWSTAVIAVVMILIIAPVQIYEKYFYKKPDFKPTKEELYRIRPWIFDSFDHVVSKTGSSGCSISIKVGENHPKELRELAGIVFTHFLIYGFIWDDFKYGDGKIQGVLSNHNKINRHKWGYLYIFYLELEGVAVHESLEGVEAMPYITQVLGYVAGQIYEPNVEFIFAQSFLKEYSVAKTKGPIAFDEVIDQENLWENPTNWQLELFKNSIVTSGFSYPEMDELEPMVINLVSDARIKQSPIIVDPLGYIERINREGYKEGLTVYLEVDIDDLAK